MCRRDWTPLNTVKLAHIAYLHPCDEQLISQAEVWRYLDRCVDARYCNDALDDPAQRSHMDILYSVDG